jgi:preprotein translocase subunit YajC
LIRVILAAGLASLLVFSVTEETITMARKHLYLYLFSFLFLSIGVACPAQTPDSPSAPQDQAQGPALGGGRNSGRGGPRDGHGTIGKITAIHGNSLQIARPDGSVVTINLNDKTEFRKDRQPAQLSDFKVGDFVMVRGDENSDHSITAQSLGGRSANGSPGVMGVGPAGGAAFGEMGKDFVAGVVKSVDAPKLTVLRADNVTQTVELNEDTSLRRGRESITMADIQPGDHIVVRGGLQNNAFVPKAVILLSAEQWERMQQFAQGRAGEAGNATAKAPAGNPPQQ